MAHVNNSTGSGPAWAPPNIPESITIADRNLLTSLRHIDPLLPGVELVPRIGVDATEADEHVTTEGTVNDMCAWLKNLTRAEPDSAAPAIELPPLQPQELALKLSWRLRAGAFLRPSKYAAKYIRESKRGQDAIRNAKERAELFATQLIKQSRDVAPYLRAIASGSKDDWVRLLSARLRQNSGIWSSTLRRELAEAMYEGFVRGTYNACAEACANTTPARYNALLDSINLSSG